MYLLSSLYPYYFVYKRTLNMYSIYIYALYIMQMQQHLSKIECYETDRQRERERERERESWNIKIVSMIRKDHNRKLQINLWHREEEPHNNYKKPGRQTKQRRLFPIKMIAKLEWKQSNEKKQHRTTTESHNGSNNQQANVSPISCINRDNSP